MTGTLIFPGDKSDLVSCRRLWGGPGQRWPRRPWTKPEPQQGLSLGLAETDHEKCPVFSPTTNRQPPAYRSDLGLSLGGCSGAGLEEAGIFCIYVYRL